MNTSILSILFIAVAIFVSLLLSKYILMTIDVLKQGIFKFQIILFASMVIFTVTFYWVDFCIQLLKHV